MAPVAALIIAGRPPVNAMVTAMVNDANSPTRGSTPARIEKLIEVPPLFWRLLILFRKGQGGSHHGTTE